MMNRKAFVSNSLLGLSGSLILGDLNASNVPQNEEMKYSLEDIKTGNKLPDNEAYWKKVATFFHRPAGFTQLEHGYFSHQPQTTLNFHQLAERNINTQTSEFMRIIQFNEIEKSRKALAVFLGVDPEELAITRNTTESLNIVIMGLNWKPGDEVVIGNQDYGSMVEAFQQAAARFGIVIKIANVPLLPKNSSEVTDAYTSLFTAKTKLVHLTHTINLTGQVIDCNAIAKEARAKGILVAVDAAHSTAHVIDKIGSLDADFIGGSLHKWLCTPVGVGYLVMKKQLIETGWPLMGDVGVAKNNIRKFEHQGTRPIHTIQSIIPAIEFHNAIGFEAKLARLQYLKYAWLKQVDGKNGLRCISPWNNGYFGPIGGAIATIQKENFTPNQLASKLMDDYKIFTVAIDHPIVKGIRVTPHLSNKIEDISYFVASLLKF